MSEVQTNSPQTARERLARISHHFLSDVDEPDIPATDDGTGAVAETNDVTIDDKGKKQAGKEPATGKAVYTLALLNTSNNGDELPAFLLSQQLAAHGHSSAVLDCNTGNLVSFMNDAQQTRTVHHGVNHNNLEDVTRRLGATPHDVNLLLLDSAESPCLSLADRILVSAPATSEGLQHTYSSIKQLFEHHYKTRIGVTITGTSDVNRAENYFNMLSSAVHRFLDRELLSYAYLAPPAVNFEQATSSRAAPVSLARSGLDTITRIISDEIRESQQIGMDDHPQTAAAELAASNESVHLKIKTVTVKSDAELRGLVIDALGDILGNSYELVNHDSPSDGKHVLALNGDKQPYVIAFDKNDGVRALLSGLSALETLSNNSNTAQRMNALIQRLHPNTPSINNLSQFRIDNTHLVVLAPKPPPGSTYLSHTLSQFSFYTFQAWKVEDKTGLLVEPCISEVDNAVQQVDSLSDKVANPFRGGQPLLSQEETTFFRTI